MPAAPSYADFAAAEPLRLSHPTLRAQLQWWVDRLRDLPSLPQLGSRPGAPTYDTIEWRHDLLARDRAATPTVALRAYAAAAAALAAASAGFAAIPSLAGWATVAGFVVAIAALTVGEMAGASAAWTLSFALAPDNRRGIYLATFAVGRTISTWVAGPLMMTGVVLALGVRGWLLLATLFALATVPPLIARGAWPR